MKLKCFNCGKTFKPGNDPKTGIPNGVGFMKNKKTYNICSECISYRCDEVSQKIEADSKKSLS